MHHDDVVRQAIQAVRDTDRDAVASAWAGSLSSRDLAARAAFGCYVVLQHLAEHAHTPSRFAGTQCAVCGLAPDNVTLRTEEELAGRKYQGFPTDLTYSVPVLAGFPLRTATAPADDLLPRVLDAVRALPPTARLSELAGAGQGVIPSNKRERIWLLETLGYAGILCPENKPHYSDEFVARDFAASQYPDGAKSDWAYPTRFWTGADGVRDELVARYFG